MQLYPSRQETILQILSSQSQKYSGDMRAPYPTARKKKQKAEPRREIPPSGSLAAGPGGVQLRPP